MDLDVVLAKIATEADQGHDALYVTEKDGARCQGGRMEAIRESLAHAIADGIA
jgi:UTP:GlnB (protein PII) uridylyltransferase